MEERTIDIIQDIERRWSCLTIADDFVFCKAMLDEDLCREVLEAILGIDINRVEYVNRQETLDVDDEAKSVRLDVYVRDDAGTVFDVEMQTVNTHELPRRVRYYQSLMALDQLRRGEPYRSLRDSYVIFVCGFDLFGRGRRVYSFQNRCDEDGELALGDGAHAVFLSASVPEDKRVGSRVNEFLDYVAHGTVSGELSMRLDKAVERVLGTEKWRLEYMMLEVRDQLNIDKGFAKGHEQGLAEGLEQGRTEGLEQGRTEGLEQGRTEGLEQGEARYAKLASRLLDDGRVEDLQASAADEDLRRRLYLEYGL